jgi:hypothetical protein
VPLAALRWPHIQNEGNGAREVHDGVQATIASRRRASIRPRAQHEANAGRKWISVI